MAQAPLRWESCAWADPIWWAQQQIKVMTATATYLARVTQAFVGAAVADAPYVPAVITADDQAGATPEEELPVARWDELSLGSIRARLSRLSEADLAHLHRYEAGYAGRPAVLSMLANRLAKIRAEADSTTASGDWPASPQTWASVAPLS